jgi:hypothetical protein
MLGFNRYRLGINIDIDRLKNHGTNARTYIW